MALHRSNAPKAYGGGPAFRHAHVKIQSVSHTHFTNEPGSGNPSTLGQEIDRLLTEEGEQGRMPNKLSIEINPPEEPDAHRIDD